MSLETNETLLTLLTVARENREERAKLLSILRLEPTRRKIAINILVTNMRREKAPESFIGAWDALQDDFLAEEAKRLIDDQKLEDAAEGVAARILVAVVLAALVGACFVWFALSQ